MMRVLKKQDRLVRACRLGDGSALERELLESGRMRLRDGDYEVFSQEAGNGAGEIARAGDYVKVDSTGAPYPNERRFFEENHVHDHDEYYRQIPRPLPAWQVGDAPSDVMDFLMSTGRLIIREDDAQRYFNAHLWGAPLSAARNAVVVFYDIERDAAGRITDVSFNFVERSEFERTYDILEE